MRCRGLLFVLALLSLGGCDREVGGSLNLRFESPQTAEAALTIEVRIHRGSCRAPSEALYSDRFFVGEKGGQPPPLDEGLYVVWAEARTAGCIPIAMGCAEVELPDDADIELMMLDEAAPVFDAETTEACEKWLARRRVLVQQAAAAAEEASSADAAEPSAGMSSSTSGASADQDPASSGPSTGDTGTASPEPGAGDDPGTDTSAMSGGEAGAGADPAGETPTDTGAADPAATDGSESPEDPMADTPAAAIEAPPVACEENCPACAAQWRCCNDQEVCGCTVVPNLCWANIGAAIP